MLKYGKCLFLSSKHALLISEFLLVGNLFDPIELLYLSQNISGQGFILFFGNLVMSPYVGKASDKAHLFLTLKDVVGRIAVTLKISFEGL